MTHPMTHPMTQSKGFLEPSDMAGPAPPPVPVPPGPGPTPPSPPGPPGPPGPPPSGNATAECKKAGGIIATKFDAAGVACCALSCGVCGGKEYGSPQDGLRVHCIDGATSETLNPPGSPLGPALILA